MRAHYFTTADLVELVHAGLATATTERMVAGKRKLEVARRENYRRRTAGADEMKQYGHAG